MRIYIDESGGFIVPEPPSSRVSCIAALVIPEAEAPSVLDDFVALRSRFTDAKEIKGSELNDEQLEAVFSTLAHHDVVAEVAIIDAGVHSAEEVRRLRAEQGDKIVGSLTPLHHPDLRTELEALKREWLSLPEQLIVQMYVMLALIDSVIRHMTLYYVQRRPNELGRFDWVVDPKDIGKTRYERVWEMVIYPFLQSLSMREPMITVEGFDYSAFARFRSPLTRMPDHLRAPGVAAEDSNESFSATDIGKLMRESIELPDSQSSPGLQIADILANATARAMNGKLPSKLWPHLGRLLVQKRKGHHSIRPITLRAGSVKAGAMVHDLNYHGYVLDQLDLYAKPMML